jgi:diguanylate cyclase (GGDEF)-like protein/PAS domain S-box-containing protein
MKALLFRATESSTPFEHRLKGWSLVLHHDSETMLDAVRSDTFDLLLIDCTDGDPKALDLCRILRSESLAEGRVLAVVPAEDPSVLADAVDVGVHEFLVYPFTGSELEARGRLLARRLEHRSNDTDREALRLAEARFRRLVVLSPDTVALHVDGFWVFVNPAGLELFGATSAQEIVGKPIVDFIAPEYRGLVEERIRQANDSDGPVPVLEQKIIRLDGELLDVEVVGVPASFRGLPATQMIIRNVTARKKTEAALRRSEQRFRDLFEGVPVGVYRISPEGILTNANRALVEILGYTTRRSLLGMDTRNLGVAPSERRLWRLRMATSGRVTNFETHIERTDGSIISVRSTAQVIRTEQGAISGYEGTVEDITDRKRAEDALHISQERFRALVQNASDLLSILDREARVLYHSPSLSRLLGFEFEERVGNYAFERLHPEDRPRLEKHFQEILSTPGQSLRTEFRIENRQGQMRVLESIFTNLLDNPAVHGVVVNSRDISERKTAEDRLVHDALHDALTGLPNRVLFMDRLGHSLDHNPRRESYRCAVLFLDLDRFKMINDSFGHAIGDLLLVQASRRLRACLRPSDTLARLGGDEFAILLDDVGDASNAVRVARRIEDELREPFQLNGREVFSSTSIGIALSTHENRRPEDLLRDADTAMYRAKSQGRAGYAIFDAAMHAQVRSQLQLETDFRHSLERRQLETYYQPIVVLETGEVAGFEALLRWRHPERGLVMPVEFVHLAEETGLIHAIGKRVLDDACRQAKRWNSHPNNTRPLFVAVNLSPRQFTQGDLAKQLADTLADFELPGEHLCLELEERATIDHPEEVLRTLKAIKNLGVRLSLDNFGTGYSSLSVLHRFPFDQVKIDRWFVRDVGTDRGSDDLVEGVLALCHWRRLQTVAGGVETPAQRHKLTSMGCTYGQGYLFSDAVDVVQADRLLQTQILGTQSP